MLPCAADRWKCGDGSNQGLAEDNSATALQNAAEDFIFDQKGLMPSKRIEGTRITRVV
jgi:hypothetical protein